MIRNLQTNTKSVDESGNFVRYLESKGFNGSVIVETISDSFLDGLSPFFVDRNVSIENASYHPEHRKVVSHDSPESSAMGYSKHGTHVAGTVVRGLSLRNSADFDGVARAAKIAFQTFPIDDSSWIIRIKDAPDIMNRVGFLHSFQSQGQRSLSVER
jgi:hypothetical protein